MTPPPKRFRRRPCPISTARPSLATVGDGQYVSSLNQCDKASVGFATKLKKMLVSPSNRPVTGSGSIGACSLHPHPNTEGNR